MTDAESSFTIPNLTPRDRARRAHGLSLTPRERLAAMQRLIDEAWSILQANPPGLARFRRRNFKARSLARTTENRPHGT